MLNPEGRAAFKRNLQRDIADIIAFIGDDPGRGGVAETPERVVKSWEQLYSGYAQDPKEVLKTFEDGACRELVVLGDVEFYSMCEHHMLPFFGKAWIGYVPNGKIVGISKLARCLDIYARRLQVQERLTTQVADAINEVIQPKGVAVVLRAQHMCMMARGVCKQDSVMTTSALRGLFDSDSPLKAEFMGMVNR